VRYEEEKFNSFAARLALNDFVNMPAEERNSRFPELVSQLQCLWRDRLAISDANKI
jgi:hypothetical protein